MKNNKIMTYLLLALVVGIWGYVIYTVLIKVNEDEPIKIRQATKIAVTENLAYYQWKDSLRYDSIYQSPFAGDTILASADQELAPQVQATGPMQGYEPMAYAPAMDIQYLGFIENEQQKQRIALLQVNGKQHYLRLHQQVEGVTLLKIGTNSIKVKTDFETLTINKK